MYTFRGFDFSDKDIDQIVHLLDLWAQGAVVDQRTLSPMVRRYARSHSFVPTPKGQFVSIISRLPNAIDDTPIEAVYRALKPAIKRHSGYTIVKDRAWRSLNLDKHHIQRIEQTLNVLAQAGYIYFESAGTIWRIEDKNE